MAGGCHPKIHMRNFTAWCEECDEVFGDKNLAENHRKRTAHEISIHEYMTSEPLYLAYFLIDGGEIDEKAG